MAAIRSLTVRTDYLRGISEEEREPVFIRAVEVGCFCLERAGGAQDFEFVRRQTEAVLTGVEKTVSSIPTAIQEELVQKIGTGDGQVLAPIHSLVREVSQVTSDRLREVRELLTREIDPARDSSTVGRVLRELRDLLDPNRTDSIQARISAALERVTAHDGTLAKTVKAASLEAVRPLADEVYRLGKEIRAQEAAEEAVRHTIEKGASYEDEVLTELRPWAKVVGAEVHHVGTDKRPGDVLVRLSPACLVASEFSIAIEARDRDSTRPGRKVINSLLSRAMAEREAQAAIFLSRSRDGLAGEIGEWAEGECEQGPWIATTHEHLTTALRLIVVQHQKAAIRETKPEVDVEAAEMQIERIRTAMARVTTINRKVTDIRNGAGAIQTEAEALRDEIRRCLPQSRTQSAL